MERSILRTVFEDTAQRFPDQPAVTEASRTIPYRQLNAYANRTAHALKGLGIGGGRIVGIYMDASIEYVVAMLGVLKAGAAFMPLNIRFPHQRLASILQKTGPDAVVTGISSEEELAQKLANPDLSAKPSHFLVFEDEANFSVKDSPGHELGAKAAGIAESDPLPTEQADDGCYLFTTSGSTGKPKAILGRQKGLSHFIHWEIAELGLDASVRASMLSPVTFDVSLRDIFVPLIAGGTLCIPDEGTRSDPGRLLWWLRDSRISLMHIVPTLFRLLGRKIKEVASSGEALPDLKYALIAGEVLYGSDVIRWQEAAGTRIELINLYGPSETTLAKMFYRIKKPCDPKEIVPIGKPIPDTEVLVIKDGRLCSVGEVGEIHIKTAFMSKGYYNDPELNARAFVQNPTVEGREEIVYRTGDFGQYLPDGNVGFAGRRDDQIKLRGIRIEVGEIEVALRQHPQVQQAAVSVKEDAAANQRLVGYVVSQPGQTPSGESLRRFLAHRLPDYMIPDIFINLDALPLTHSGKVDRRALPEPGQARPELEVPYVPPSTDLERTLAECWGQVLNLERVGIHDNFFDLGGNSLLGVQMWEMLRRKLGFDPPITKLFEYPNVGLLAKYFSDSKKEGLSCDAVQARAARRREAHSRRRETRSRG